MALVHNCPTTVTRRPTMTDDHLLFAGRTVCLSVLDILCNKRNGIFDTHFVFGIFEIWAPWVIGYGHGFGSGSGRLYVMIHDYNILQWTEQFH